MEIASAHPTRRLRGALAAGLTLVICSTAADEALAKKPKLSVTDATVAERGSVEVGVSLSKRAKRAVRSSIETRDGSATAGSDYDRFSGSLRIAKRSRSATIEIPIRADEVDERDEEFTIELSAPRRAKIADGTGIVRILDDDASAPGGGEPEPDPTVSLTTTSVPEGTSGNPVRSIAVGLSDSSAETVQVDYATVNDTATAPGDFAATSGTLTFAPGATSDSFNLTTVGDYDNTEVDETLTIAFSNPVHASLPIAPETLTIADDDPDCVAADTPAAALDLGAINGDSATGSGPLTPTGEISPCGDTDWFKFALAESSGTQTDLRGRIVLSSPPNDSPQAGDLDLCARLAGNAASEVCSDLAGGGTTETVHICVDDPFAPGDQTTAIELEVDGFGNAVNSYSLDIRGNTVAGTGEILNLGC